MNLDVVDGVGLREIYTTNKRRAAIGKRKQRDRDAPPNSLGQPCDTNALSLVALAFVYLRRIRRLIGHYYLMNHVHVVQEVAVGEHHSLWLEHDGGMCVCA